MIVLLSRTARRLLRQLCVWVYGVSIVTLIGLWPDAARAQSDWTNRDDVREFIREMASRHGFSEAELTEVFARTRASETAVRLMTPAPAGAKKSWSQYRSRFIEPVRMREGLRFWREHRATLRRASARFGVPEEIIVSIIGIETLYGRQAGDFRVMDALTTLTFDYPRRAAFFREELEQYLLLARDNGFDPLQWRGSFAGAVGLPQFMPGSIRRHAIDFDGDGRIDLRASPSDAIGSVANFLVNHGWRPGGPTHFPALVKDEILAVTAVQAGIPPKLSIAELAAQGVSSPRPLPEGEPLSLIDLPDGDLPTQYVLGAHNFYVITRYNRSYFYAMAVIDFARELRGALDSANARSSASR
jgi:membrane-bound lytic murein transglycosylase B